MMLERKFVTSEFTGTTFTVPLENFLYNNISFLVSRLGETMTREYFRGTYGYIKVKANNSPYDETYNTIFIQQVDEGFVITAYEEFTIHSVYLEALDQENECNIDFIPNAIPEPEPEIVEERITYRYFNNEDDYHTGSSWQIHTFIPPTSPIPPPISPDFWIPDPAEFLQGDISVDFIRNKYVEEEPEYIQLTVVHKFENGNIIKIENFDILANVDFSFSTLSGFNEINGNTSFTVNSDINVTKYVLYKVIENDISHGMFEQATYPVTTNTFLSLSLANVVTTHEIFNKTMTLNPPNIVNQWGVQWRLNTTTSNITINGVNVGFPSTVNVAGPIVINLRYTQI